jgi:protein phosphatase
MTLALRYAARSDRGLVRANNEDSVYAGARLLALADGMGGHAAGEVASQLVIAALAHLDDDEPGGDLLSKLETAVHEGNSAIAEHVEIDPELDGMAPLLPRSCSPVTGWGWFISATLAATCCATVS